MIHQGNKTITTDRFDLNSHFNKLAIHEQRKKKKNFNALGVIVQWDNIGIVKCKKTEYTSDGFARGSTTTVKG